MKNKIDYDELQDLLKTHQHIEIRGTILIKFEQTPYLRVIIRELNGNGLLDGRYSRYLMPFNIVFRIVFL